MTTDYTDFTDVLDAGYPRHPWLIEKFPCGLCVLLWPKESEVKGQKRFWRLITKAHQVFPDLSRRVVACTNPLIINPVKPPSDAPQR